MWLVWVLAAALVLPVSAFAVTPVEPQVSSPAGGDAEPGQHQQPKTTPLPAPEGELPVSLDRIREGLARGSDDGLLAGVEHMDRQPDFRIEIEEQQKFEELLERLKMERPGPVPPGGLYGYEQQQRAFNPVNRPLMQPYAAFNPTELTVIALQNLIGRYIARRAASAIGGARRAAAEREAREEVIAAIAGYCAAQPDRGAGIEICTIGP